MGLWMVFIFFHMLFCMCLYIFPFSYFYKSEKFVSVFDKKKKIRHGYQNSYHKLFWLATNFFLGSYRNRWVPSALRQDFLEHLCSSPCEEQALNRCSKGVVGGLSSNKDHLAPKPHSAPGKSETQAKEADFSGLEVVKMSLQSQRAVLIPLHWNSCANPWVTPQPSQENSSSCQAEDEQQTL